MGLSWDLPRFPEGRPGGTSKAFVPNTDLSEELAEVTFSRIRINASGVVKNAEKDTFFRLYCPFSLSRRLRDPGNKTREASNGGHLRKA